MREFEAYEDARVYGIKDKTRMVAMEGNMCPYRIRICENKVQTEIRYDLVRNIRRRNRTFSVVAMCFNPITFEDEVEHLCKIPSPMCRTLWASAKVLEQIKGEAQLYRTWDGITREDVEKRAKEKGIAIVVEGCT